MGGGKFSTFNSSWTLTPFLIKSAIIVFPLRSEKKRLFHSAVYVTLRHTVSSHNNSKAIFINTGWRFGFSARIANPQFDIKR